MAIRNNTFILKRSNVVNKIPALSGLTLGELALNTADVKLYSLYTGGLTGATEVREIGWNRLSVSGGTLYGNLNVLGSVSATTYYGDGSNLTGINDYYVTGGTYSSGILTLNRQNGSVTVTGLLSADTFVTGFTFSSNTLTILQNQGQPPLTASIATIDISNIFSAVTFNIGTTGSISATTFYGDGSNLTGINDFYVTGGTYSNGTLTLNRQNGSVTINGLNFTGNTSATCITDLFVSNLNSCSPLHIQPINNGNVLIGENGGVNVGIGTSTPLYKLHISGETSNTELRYVDSALFPRFNITTNNGDDLTFSQVLDSTSNSSLSLVFRGYSEASSNSYGKQGDGILYASTNVNGLNIINNQNAARENYIRLYAGGNPSNKTSDIHIQGSGTTNGNVGINNNSPSAKLHIVGSDSSSSNYGLKVQNSGGTDNLVVRNDGNVGIGTSTPTEKLEVSGKTSTTTLQVTSGATAGYVLTALDSNGNAYWAPATTGSTTTGTDTFVTGFTYSNNNLTILQNQGQSPLSVNISTMTGLTINGNLTVTGNTVVRGITGTTALLSSSGQNVLTVIGSGSTLPIFTVQGSQGELFSVTDSLTGSLFSVNDISGLPILEVFSDNTILMGSYLAPSLNTTIRTTANIGSTTIYSIPISAYTGAFFEYTVNDGTNLRAGSIMSIWSGNTVNYTETSTTDIGNTNPITFNMISSSGFASLRTSATTNSWTVKTIVRSI